MHYCVAPRPNLHPVYPVEAERGLQGGVEDQVLDSSITRDVPRSTPMRPPPGVGCIECCESGWFRVTRNRHGFSRISHNAKSRTDVAHRCYYVVLATDLAPADLRRLPGHQRVRSSYTRTFQGASVRRNVETHARHDAQGTRATLGSVKMNHKVPHGKVLQKDRHFLFQCYSAMANVTLLFLHHLPSHIWSASVSHRGPRPWTIVSHRRWTLY